MELIFLKPFMKEVIWGGDRINKEFGYDAKSDNIGEAWIVSANNHGYSTIINEKYKSKTLKELWEEYPNIFGNESERPFPFLIKYIDAKDNLSIQVHPDDEYAKRVEKEPNGKAECWYIVDCDKDSDIIIGHNAKTKEEFIEMIKNKQWDKLLTVKKIKKGDFFDIPTGTVHAIRKGTLILEVQQNSDITYRLYDYDRLQNGKLRELHIQKSIDVVNAPHKVQKNVEKINENITTLISNKNFTVTKYDLNEENIAIFEKSFFVICVINGKGSANGINIKKGDNFIVPYNYGELQIEGNLEFVCIKE